MASGRAHGPRSGDLTPPPDWRARLRAPYPDAAPTLLLAALVPMYMAIAVVTRGSALGVPAVPLDGAIPLEPAWVFVYVSQWVFSFLPVFVVRGTELRRRAVRAFLAIVVVSYAGFLLYPTLAPRPEAIPGDGFASWALRYVYGVDPPTNCFPSLHVAYSVLAALTAYRVHRGVGALALGWAGVIALSTLFTKQHYVLDVVAGIALAVGAWALFIRGYRRADAIDGERRRTPRRALVVVWLYALLLLVLAVAYALPDGVDGEATALLAPQATPGQQCCMQSTKGDS